MPEVTAILTTITSIVAILVSISLAYKNRADSGLSKSSANKELSEGMVNIIGPLNTTIERLSKEIQEQENQKKIRDAATQAVVEDIQDIIKQLEKVRASAEKVAKKVKEV